MRSRMRAKIRKARKMIAETTTSKMVCGALLGRMNDRFSEAWLQPMNKRNGTAMSRKIRKARRGGFGLLTGAISFYPNLLSLVKMNLVDGRTGGSLQGAPWISVARQVWLKRTALTCGRLPFAVPLSGFDQERVKLIKKPLIGRQMPVQKLLRGRIAVLL